jgi:hypothetical protein
MSTGYVTVTNARRPDRVRTKGSPVAVNLSAVNPQARFSVNDYLFSNPITSFRSGPALEREVRKPGAVFGEQTLNEFLVSQAGDLGHEFSMKRVTDFYGSTKSKRINTTLSPFWSQLTSPVPCGFTNSIGNTMNVERLLDRGNTTSAPQYGFVKSDSDLITLGTSFIKSTNPIQSQVNLLSDIAEALVDGALLPAIIGKQIVSSIIDPRKRGGLIRAIGGEYLNFIFGYKPLADDIAKTGVLIDTVNKLVDQWIKDNGTIVRRRRRVPSDTVVSEDRSLYNPFGSLGSSFSLWFPVPGSMSNQLDPAVRGITETNSVSKNFITNGFMVRTVDSEITFSAGYEYDFSSLYLPVAGGSAADLMHDAALRADLTAIAFGLDPASIATATYDATPFSWLLDWFVNLGDVIDNFRGLQARGVQMLWGYITETATRNTYFEYDIAWGLTGDHFFQSTGRYVQKSIRRVRATPFGFGTSFGSLSASQSATLAALAATR